MAKQNWGFRLLLI